MFAIIDCNNFYASCERLFRPDLHMQPIVVLSNNDGCVIARSEEAKTIGIKMGEPFFKIKELSKKYRIHIFSSNYTLYGDLSHRVMCTIEDAWPDVEIYSIDEAFLDLSTMPEAMHNAFCTDLQRTIFRHTGIPVSIGIGPTKTLAKLANYICKRRLKIPVFNISNERHWLSQIDVGEVWGVGRQWQKKLALLNILTAHDLANIDSTLMKKRFNVVLTRTSLELQGISCIGMEVAEAKKSIMSSKSFGTMQTSFDALAEAISSHCARACEKARNGNLIAGGLHVFVHSNRHRQDLKQYMNSIDCRLITPTADTRCITEAAKRGLKKIFQSGIHYKKVGIMLFDLIDKNVEQFDMFEFENRDQKNKSNVLMGLLDEINQRYGSHTIKLAAEGYSKTWKMRSEMRSPCYTTRWDDLPTLKIF